ncbi:putative actin-like protein [Clavispora lusitaniae]|uniref:Actin-like protein n=1 Tax=Clavispora lusitaniae TaxID=36911 RepID=A0ACD0WGD7_CLALS|nr:putative actin-like protein [Clavispora lusitaniae]QFZ31911.1 putative actin-like protein [Clavispora lusitaniae]QFZ37580.1 putative actin-like protein [Clavispora lusitaniae]QFZ43264.1 putative actin-like protein [Clavispora lusitaniae]QFZ48940.1 putative actin-like protein [Clavispora lusitaniae]
MRLSQLERLQLQLHHIMPLFREENFLVVHAGSEHTLFLFGLRDTLTPPQYKIPTVVYLDTTANEYKASNPTGTLQEIRPIKGSRIVDVPAFEALLKFILQTIVASNPIVTINQIPLLLIVPSISYSRYAVEEITRFVFETLEFTAFNVLDLSVAAGFGVGATSSALVVNVGHESTQIMPVASNMALKYAGMRLEVGGKTIDEDLQKLLPHFSAQQIHALKTSPVYEVLNNHDDTFYSLTELDENKESSAEEYEVAKIITEDTSEEEKKAEDARPNSELEKNSFVDPTTGSKIVVGKERFQGTARLVQTIAEAIGQCLQKVPDLDKRQECYDNIIFVGSTFNIPGLRQAIILETCRQYLVLPPSTKKKSKGDQNGINSTFASYQQADEPTESNEATGATQVPSSIKMVKLPDYFPEWKKPKDRGGSWADAYFLGAEIYAKQIFGANSNHGDSFIDTEIYEGRGPLAIWEVSI